MLTKICILFGGKSIEHEISILSMKNLLPFFKRNKYDITLIGIDRKGLWHVSDQSGKMDDPKPFYEIFSLLAHKKIEVVFPILHGLNGEDGTIQGLLEIADLPYVGPSVLSAAVGLDKDVMKRLLRDGGLPVGDFLTFTELPDFEEVKQRLGLPIYIKPVNMGSTLGITIAYSEGEFAKGFALAKQFDRKVICEKKIVGRELECSVIGLENPIVSLPAEIEPKTETYSYQGKYFDRSLTNYIYPANIDPELTCQIQEMALSAYKVLCGEVMSRVDFFLTQEGELLVNEINTIPGFTYMSMFHRMWEVTNLPTDELVDRLIEYAFQRHQRKHELHYIAHEDAVTC